MQKKWSLLTLSVIVFLNGCGGSSSGRCSLIQNKGSDTLVNVAQVWAEEYKKVNPSVSVAVTEGGSGTGISAMINGTVDLANSSRKMKPREVEAAQQNGTDPIESIVGYDALAVFLHSDNPISEMTFEQLKGIYGERGGVENRAQLGHDRQQICSARSSTVPS